jgi:hypothetical protein
MRLKQLTVLDLGAETFNPTITQPEPIRPGVDDSMIAEETPAFESLTIPACRQAEMEFNPAGK